jgi:hypothetical protein
MREKLALEEVEHPKNVPQKKLQTLEFILKKNSTLCDKNLLRYLKKTLVPVCFSLTVKN